MEPNVGWPASMQVLRPGITDPSGIPRMTQPPERAGPPDPVAIVGDAALFRSIAEAVGDAVIVTSAEMEAPGPTIEYVNPGFTSMTGYRPDEAIGKTPRILQGPKTDRTVMEQLRTAVKAGQSFIGTSVNYRKDGTEFINEWMIAPFRDDGGTIVHWISVQRDVTERVRAETRQKVLLHELDHRVMNNLAAVQALAARIGRTSASVEAFRAALQERLLALSQAQRAIAAAHWQGVPLQLLVQAQLAPFGMGSPGRVAATGPEIRLRSGAAVVLGLALHELGLNALRHGSLSAPAGHVGLTWSVVPTNEGDRVRIEWEEAGGPVVAPPAHRGFGLRLIQDVLVRELRGTVDLVFGPSGVRCVIEAPLAGILERRA